MFTTNAKNQVKKVGIDIAQSMGDLTWTMVDQAAKGFDAMKKTPLLSSVDPMQAYGAIKDVASDVVGERGMQAQKMQRQTNDISGELAKTIGDLVAKKSLSVKEAQGLLENLPRTAADPNASKMKAFLNGIKAGSVATGIAGGVSEAATMALGDQNPLTKMRGMGAPQPQMKTNQKTIGDADGEFDGLTSAKQPSDAKRMSPSYERGMRQEMYDEVADDSLDSLSPDDRPYGLGGRPGPYSADSYDEAADLRDVEEFNARMGQSRPQYDLEASQPQPRFKTNQPDIKPGQQWPNYDAQGRVVNEITQNPNYPTHPEATSSLYSPNQKVQMSADEQWFDDAANRLAGDQVDAGGPMPGPGAAGKGRAPIFGGELTRKEALSQLKAAGMADPAGALTEAGLDGKSFTKEQIDSVIQYHDTEGLNPPRAAGKGKMNPQKLELKAYDQQAKEIERTFGKKAASDANYGWGVDEVGDSLKGNGTLAIQTKVYGKGVLNTEVDLKTGEMTHDWSDDALDAMGEADDLMPSQYEMSKMSKSELVDEAWKKTKFSKEDLRGMTVKELRSLMSGPTIADKIPKARAR